MPLAPVPSPDIAAANAAAFANDTAQHLGISDEMILALVKMLALGWIVHDDDARFMLTERGLQETMWRHNGGSLSCP